MSSSLAREYFILSEIATNIRSGFILLNPAEQVTYFNPSAERLIGITSEMLHEHQVFDVRKHLISLAANPENAQAELDRIWLHPEQESSLDLALADAAIRWLRVQSFPVRDDLDLLLGRGVLLDDITLEHSSAQARNETLALAAHELKTLLDVWRLDAGVQNLRLSEVHISKLLEQLVERWRNNASRHQFVFDVPPEDIIVQCDALRIEQAFNHLINNAVAYSSMGSAIKIQLETNDVEICLSISDQGVGIAPEHLDHIFDRFYRISPGEQRSHGSGLGLSIVRATIETHGGKIWADSPGIGLGTTFLCTLPFTPSKQTEPLHHMPSETAIVSSSGVPLTTPRTVPLRQSQRSKVLVVENDARIARYLRAHLTEQQYHVHTLSHGIQLLRQLDLEEPDIILLAARLPDMSGAEVLQRLREFSAIPVMMLCDESDEDEHVRFLNIGADDLVLKHVSIKELLAGVRVLLRRTLSLGDQPTGDVIFKAGELTIDYAQHQVHVRGQPVQLSRTEYKLLCTLAQNAGRVLTHELLLERVWGAEYNREVDFIWVYISRLRRKIELDPRHPRYILTVPDVGYKLVKL